MGVMAISKQTNFAEQAFSLKQAYDPVRFLLAMAHLVY
jgi:hypothetical protein